MTTAKRNRIQSIALHSNGVADVIRVLQILEDDVVIASGDPTTQTIHMYDDLMEMNLETAVLAVLQAAWPSEFMRGAIEAKFADLKAFHDEQKVEADKRLLELQTTLNAVAAANGDLNAEHVALAQREEQISTQRQALFNDRRDIAAQRALVGSAAA